ncbi:MAG: hypothetical protein JO146_00630 [Candidatus Eremiobacteraeota bacterium]|nr:hypothetical protein [Candidatus Eremiobacteraeota bacterium]
MNDVIASLKDAVDAESPREQRAAAAAHLVRIARGYRWVGIYDVGDDDVTLIGEAGSPSSERVRPSLDERSFARVLETRRAIVDRGDAVAPVLGAESGIVIGTLDIEIAPTDVLGVKDIDFLEDCAAALRPLYD